MDEDSRSGNPGVHGVRSRDPLRRVLLEHGELFALLATDESAMQVYKSADARQHRDNLAPRKVRSRLKERGLELPWIERHLSGLSVRAIHPPFDAIIASHSPGKIVVGPLFQPAGYLLALNELSLAAITLLFRVATTATDLSESGKRDLLDVGKGLATHGGGVTIDHLPDGMVHEVPSDRWLEAEE